MYVYTSPFGQVFFARRRYRTERSARAVDLPMERLGERSGALCRSAPLATGYIPVL
jgi:hypothetical protein